MSGILELCYLADRKDKGKGLEELQSPEETAEWLKQVVDFRADLRAARDALQRAYYSAPAPRAVDYMEEYLRSVCMIDSGFRGILEAALKDVCTCAIRGCKATICKGQCGCVRCRHDYEDYGHC